MTNIFEFTQLFNMFIVSLISYDTYCDCSLYSFSLFLYPLSLQLRLLTHPPLSKIHKMALPPTLKHDTWWAHNILAGWLINITITNVLTSPPHTLRFTAHPPYLKHDNWQKIFKHQLNRNCRVYIEISFKEEESLCFRSRVKRFRLK